MEFVDKYIGEIITAVLGLLGMFGTNLINKRKLNAENRSAELDNELKARDIYKTMLDDVKKEIQEQRTEIDALKKKLKEEIEYWKKRYDSLKKDFEQYRTEHP